MFAAAVNSGTRDQWSGAAFATAMLSQGQSRLLGGWLRTRRGTAGDGEEFFESYYRTDRTLQPFRQRVLAEPIIITQSPTGQTRDNKRSLL
jgi:hypothetical protein